ncbi:MAG TPA: histidine kinase [Thermoanaerobaculia bacterium]|nr:histidine kinase [Thermoanaerobaculia bacterium]
MEESRRSVRPGAYALAGPALAALAVATIVLAPTMGVALALGSSIPPAILFAFIGIASRYPARALPIRSARPLILLATHAGGAAVAASFWLLAWRSWLRALQSFGAGSVEPPPAAASSLFIAGMLLYLVTVIVHYLAEEIEASAESRQAALRYQLLAREAELKAFKSQIDPHFLFNSLNAISSLCGSSPEGARAMSQGLADFFRRSLRLGMRERITLGEEIELAASYLAIESARFGSRLTVEIDVQPEAAVVEVPPLLLQPLVENAVRHGIASLVEGGTVAVKAAISDDALLVTVENPADPERSSAKGEGIGLANVRGRLAAVYDDAASLHASESGGKFRVAITLPAKGGGVKR